MFILDHLCCIIILQALGCVSSNDDDSSSTDDVNDTGTSNKIILEEFVGKENEIIKVDVATTPKNISDVSEGPKRYSIDDEEETLIIAEQISILDEFAIEDKTLVLAHIQSDIEDLEDLKDSIKFLESHLRKHADIHVVRSQEVQDADAMLTLIDEQVIKTYGNQLRALKTQIRNSIKIDEQSRKEVNQIVLKAEEFLQSSMDKINNLEMLDQEWEVQEEDVKIQQLIHEDEVQEYSSNILVNALKPTNESQQVKSSISDEGLDKNLQKSKFSILEGHNLYESLKNFTRHHKVDIKNDSETDTSDVSISPLSEDLITNDSKETFIKMNKAQENVSMYKEKSRMDVVYQYSPDIKKALEKAKNISRDFINNRLHSKDIESEAVTISYLHMVIGLLSFVTFVVVFLLLKKLRSKKRVLSFSALTEASRMELQSVRGHDGLFSRNSLKKNQYKFK